MHAFMLIRCFGWCHWDVEVSCYGTKESGALVCGIWSQLGCGLWTGVIGTVAHEMLPGV